MDSHYVSAYVWPTLCPLHPSLQQDICYVEVGVQWNGKQLFSSVTYSKLIELGEECVIYLLIFLTDIFTNYPRNIHKKKFWILEKKLRTHEAPMRKDFAHTKHPREKFRTHEIPTRNYLGSTKAQWHETYETQNGMRSTEFSTFLSKS